MFRALFLCAALLSTLAIAQEDDDLPALPTAKPKTKGGKAKGKPSAKPKQTQTPTPTPAPVGTEDDLPPLPPVKGELLVKLLTPMKGAKLFIDDKEVGLLPQPAQSLNNGEHTVAVHRAGFAPYSKKVKVDGNKTSEVSVTLEATAAVLAVSTDVIGAQVFVNGRFAGTAPLEELEVPPGKVELSVKKDGYHDGTQMVTVKAGHDYPIDVKLGAPIAAAVAANDAPTPPPDLSPHDLPSSDIPGPVGVTAHSGGGGFYTQWWFWTGVAVVVAVIVGVSVYAGTRPAPQVPLARADFPCYAGMCAGWLNEPAAIVNPWPTAP
jgi:hypothetical protein